MQVPLVEDDKKVVVPFTPDFMTGQFYFPFTKGQRVELSMYFHTAKIMRLSDWQPLARLPMGVQGNQMVLASNGKDKYVIIKHEFENGKNSIFTITQSSSPTQTQVIKVLEKEITITVDEKDKKNLFVQLNKDTGLTLSLEDKTAGVTQQIFLDGKSITHMCKGKPGTSSIIQTPDTITVTSKNVTLSCDEIFVNAKNSISVDGTNKVTINGKKIEIPGSCLDLGS